MALEVAGSNPVIHPNLQDGHFPVACGAKPSKGRTAIVRVGSWSLSLRPTLRRSVFIPGVEFHYPMYLKACHGGPAEPSTRRTVMRAVWRCTRYYPSRSSGWRGLVPRPASGGRGRMLVAFCASLLWRLRCPWLMRWPGVHWGWRRIRERQGLTRAQHGRHIRRPDVYLGQYIGEFLGELAMATFSC